jgi:hypothetical protein
MIDSGIKIVKNPEFNKKAQKYKKRVYDNLTEFFFSDDNEEDESVNYLPIEVDSKDIEK